MERNKETRRFLAVLIIALAAIVAGIVLGGCSPRVVKVPVEVRSESVRVDSVRVAVVRADTVVRSDTVCITLSEAGDTVRLVQTRWRERVSLLHDTVRAERVDTVYMEKAVPVAVETKREVKKVPVIIILVLFGIGIVLMWKAYKR